MFAPLSTAHQEISALAAVDVAAFHSDAMVIVPPRSRAVPSETAETAPTQRDRHLNWLPSMVVWVGRRRLATTSVPWSKPVLAAGNG
jgi:hypothetical protein